MGGVVFSALAGGLAGAGSGMNDIGKNMMLEDNLKLKADLDQQREVRLQEMRSASAENVATIGADASRDVADTHAAASGYAAETAAGASEYHADTMAGASKYAADTGLKGHQISAGATVKAAQIHADAAARNIQTDKDGNVFQVKDGKATYITDEDGEPIKSSKDLTPQQKMLVDGYQKRLQKLEADFNDPQKGMLIRSNKDESARYMTQIADLQGRIYSTLGLDPADFAPPPSRAGAANRPPLSTFVK